MREVERADMRGQVPGSSRVRRSVQALPRSLPQERWQRRRHAPVAVELSEHETATKGDFYDLVNRERERRTPCAQGTEKTWEISVERDDDPSKRKPACPVRHEAPIGKEIEDEESRLGQEQHRVKGKLPYQGKR